MNNVQPLAARFYHLTSGHAPVGTYQKRSGHRDDDKCWWCCGGGCPVAQIREHLFRHCSRWKDQQKMLRKEVGKATGWRTGRCRHVQVSELPSMEKCDNVVMDFLAATDVGKFPPRIDRRGRAGGLRGLTSFPLYSILTVVLLDAFFCQKGTTGSRSGAPPSSRPARRRGGLRGCHTLSRVNTV